MPTKSVNRFARPRLSFALPFTVAVAFALAAIIPKLYSAARAAAPDSPMFRLPIACTLGTDCWLVNLMDTDSGPGVRDFRCTTHSYDGHKGTDIAIRDLAAMRAGVPVLAAAAGTVQGVRDGMADVDVSIAGRGSVKGRECGNGLVIRHAMGWETQYCHLRRGSLAVKPGQRVAAGQRLGLVGHSGLAQFPHVHLSVRHAGKPIDPFTGRAASVPSEKFCGSPGRPLWAEPHRAQLNAGETAVYNAGLAGGRPDKRDIRAGRQDATPLTATAPALVIWTDIYWVHEGDELTLSISGPEDNIVRTLMLPKTQARLFFFVGKKRKRKRWAAGNYKAEIALKRRGADGGVKTFSAAREVTVE